MSQCFNCLIYQTDACPFPNFSGGKFVNCSEYRANINESSKLLEKQHDAKVIDKFIELLENESYHEDCYGDYPSSSMVVAWDDILKVKEQLKQQK